MTSRVSVTTATHVSARRRLSSLDPLRLPSRRCVRTLPIHLPHWVPACGLILLLLVHDALVRKDSGMVSDGEQLELQAGPAYGNS